MSSAAAGLELQRFFAGLTPDEFAQRVAAARRMVEENGVTYNLYDDAVGLTRAWELDIVPFVIDPDEWAHVERAIVQRAHLADLILRDVYGPQRLIHEGQVPPHIIYGHPHYLRALQGAEPLGGVRAHLYAADLTRSADGAWTVLASRVDAPSGVGYALENRIVMSQTLPELFGDLSVRRLASFFADFREAVFGLARGIRGRAALLTPGPYNEAYFEHAFLAHYLGLELVEGGDLAARDGGIYVRTIGGLARVSAIFRRLDSDFCDPVELRADSALGIPGLVDAVHAGGVVIANALGNGVVDSPALDAYLPSIARWFGEELLIPDVPTIWCGTEWGRKAALARLSSMVVRDAFDAHPLFSQRSTARLGHELSAEEGAALREQLARRGATVVVQEPVAFGTAPTFENGAFTERPISLRVFAAWTPNGYVVMPGGLARIAADTSLRALSMQSGAASKDTWIPARGQVDAFSLLRPPSAPVTLRRSADEAPSRAMNNLYWLARYAERVESLVRILRAIVTNTGEVTAVARRLLAPFQREPGIVHHEALADELHAIVFGDQPYGLTSMLGSVGRTAWAVRDRLSVDTWRAVLALTAEHPSEAARVSFQGNAARTYLEALIERTAAISGLAAENMTRGYNWLFFDLGRRIERAALSCDVVRQIFVIADPRESEAVQIALEVADSAMTYRYRYLNVFQVAPALDLLLLDQTNPHATRFQLDAIAHHVDALPETTAMQQRSIPKTLAANALAAITEADVWTLSATYEAGYRAALDRFVGGIGSGMAELSDAIGDAYFQHATHDPSLATAREIP